jgi:hypothetical protein
MDFIENRPPEVYFVLAGPTLQELSIFNVKCNQPNSASTTGQF